MHACWGKKKISNKPGISSEKFLFLPQLYEMQIDFTKIKKHTVENDKKEKEKQFKTNSWQECISTASIQRI